jgi:hypothetical protein
MMLETIKDIFTVHGISYTEEKDYIILDSIGPKLSVQINNSSLILTTPEEVFTTEIEDSTNRMTLLANVINAIVRPLNICKEAYEVNELGKFLIFSKFTEQDASIELA